jgi:hypothetical protein
MMKKVAWVILVGSFYCSKTLIQYSVRRHLCVTTQMAKTCVILQQLLYHRTITISLQNCVTLKLPCSLTVGPSRRGELALHPGALRRPLREHPVVHAAVALRPVAAAQGGLLGLHGR